MTRCSFSTVRERDMDLLFLQSIVTDPGFCELVLQQTCYAGKSFKVLNAELSRTELDLGESDITVILEIEDKVGAIAMPDQHKRYQLRGEKGKNSGEWQEFEIFIFCPEKYHNNDTEAKEYEHYLSYEDCKNILTGSMTF